MSFPAKAVTQVFGWSLVAVRDALRRKLTRMYFFEGPATQKQASLLYFLLLYAIPRSSPGIMFKLGEFFS